MALLLFAAGNEDTMESKPQAAEAPQQAPDASAREPVDPGRQMFVSQGKARENRVSEPAVATDGQIVEAGYGHGV